MKDEGGERDRMIIYITETRKGEKEREGREEKERTIKVKRNDKKQRDR